MFSLQHSVPALRTDQAHIWSFRLDVPQSQLGALHLLLSPDERARAEQFRLAHLKSRFTAGRGLLRQILSGYLGEKPEAIRFSYGPYGKPEIQGAALKFNLAHSEGWALVAVTARVAVGVDVEIRRNIPDPLALAKSVFTLAEQEELAGAPGEQRSALFLQGWTRKEAVIKALGTGFSAPVTSLEIGLGPHAQMSATSPWHVCTLNINLDLVAALATLDRQVSVHHIGLNSQESVEP